MLRKLVGTIFVAAIVMVLSGVSFANLIEIDLLYSAQNTAWGGNTGAHFTAASGTATQNPNQGTYWLTAGSYTGSGCNTACTLSGGPQTLTVTIGPDTLVGTITFDSEFGGMFLNGTLDITSSTPGFTNTGYAAGQTVATYFTLNNRNHSISVAEIDTDSAVPEPGTIAMLGSGLLAVAGVLRRRWL